MAVVPVTIYECKDGSSLHLVGCDEGLNGFTAGGCLAQSWQKRLVTAEGDSGVCVCAIVFLLAAACSWLSGLPL